jgi:ribosomal protein L16 Arg81 hydroxylase
VIITNAVVPETVPKTILDKQELKALYGNVKVRTGNRETLIDNGFMNSIPKRLADALEETNNTSNTECGTIVFSPIQELPDTFIDELHELMDAFPSCTNSDISIGKMKFTLTIASEGFGIGMHKHNAAMFMLLVGRKKWYMTDSANLDGIVSESETHPRFYRELSSHKCIQQAGEVLYVPNGWYHEIFNLEYTLGIQALPE